MPPPSLLNPLLSSFPTEPLVFLFPPSHPRLRLDSDLGILPFVHRLIRNQITREHRGKQRQFLATQQFAAVLRLLSPSQPIEVRSKIAEAIKLRESSPLPQARMMSTRACIPACTEGRRLEGHRTAPLHSPSSSSSLTASGPLHRHWPRCAEITRDPKTPSSQRSTPARARSR